MLREYTINMCCDMTQRNHATKWQECLFFPFLPGLAFCVLLLLQRSRNRARELLWADIAEHEGLQSRQRSNDWADSFQGNFCVAKACCSVHLLEQATPFGFLLANLCARVHKMIVLCGKRFHDQVKSERITSAMIFGVQEVSNARSSHFYLQE